MLALQPRYLLSETAAGHVPVVSASATPASGVAPLAVLFSGTVTGGAGAPYTHAWTFGDGATSTVQSPTHTYAAAGNYTARYTATDAAGLTASATVAITVTEVTTALVATAGASPVNGVAPLAVAFAGSAAGGAPPYTYAWDFGDGSAAAAIQNPPHTYYSPGTFTARLTVTDAAFATDADTKSITATSSGGPTIKPPEYWESQANLATDLSQFEGYSKSSDSVAYYTLAYSMTGHVAMYRATGLTKYLDRALLYTNNMISKATPQAGGYLGWKSASNGNTETSLYEVYCWRYVCELLEAMINARVTGSYLTQLNSIQAFTERNIFDRWYSKGVNSNLYRSVVHICSHWGTISDFVVRRSANATRVSQARTVRDAIDHVGMANWNGDSIRHAIVAHPNNSAAAFWHAYWPKVAGGGNASGIPGVDKTYGSDVAHGSDTLSWIVEAYDRGYGPWAAADMTKFINLFGIIWPVGDATAFEYFITSGGTRKAFNPNTGFLKLGRYDRKFQVRLEGTSSSQNMGRWGNMALNAKLLGA